MKKSLLIRILSVICLVSVCFLPVLANSALTYWKGSEGSGAVSSDEDCPVEVEHETLTFFIHDQPMPGMEIDDSRPYSNSFTAEYTFHNPSDMHVRALLSFPFGRSPSYIASGNYEDPSLYRVEVNGEPVKAEVRYTVKPESSSFSLEEDLPKLADAYITDPFFTPDLKVTEYKLRFHIDESNVLENQAVSADTSFAKIPGQQKIMIEPDLMSIRNYDDFWEISLGVHDQTEISVCVFGKEFDQLPEWKFYTDTATEQTDITGEAEVMDQKEMSYEEFVLSRKEKPEDISDLDYYNAVTTMLSYRYSDASMIEWEDYIADKMMKWLQYELEFEPGETLVNAVSAPAFPDIDASYKPPMYVYYYLLSPASSWKKFGTLDVVIETDQYLQKNSPGTFEKTGSGYKAHFDSLPDGDLSFSLSASEEVQRETNPGYWILPLLVIGVPLIALILVIILMVTVIRLIRKRRKEQ